MDAQDVAQGRGRILHMNERLRQMWSLPTRVGPGSPAGQGMLMAREALMDPEGFEETISDLYAHPEKESFDVLRLKDGRVIERYSRAMRPTRITASTSSPFT